MTPTCKDCFHLYRGLNYTKRIPARVGMGLADPKMVNLKYCFSAKCLTYEEEVATPCHYYKDRDSASWLDKLLQAFKSRPNYQDPWGYPGAYLRSDEYLGATARLKDILHRDQ